MWLATLTLRHDSGHRLADLSLVLAQAWRAFTSGRWGQAWKERLGVEGSARGWETTWGRENGWHPHYHVALWLTPELQPSTFAPFALATQLKAERHAEALRGRAARLEKAAARRLLDGDAIGAGAKQERADYCRRRAAAWDAKAAESERLHSALTGSREELEAEMTRRWRSAVRRTCEEFAARAVAEDDEDADWAHEYWVRGIAPNLERGLDLRPCTAAEYAAKLGYEVAGVGKHGQVDKDGRYGPWDLAFWASLPRSPEDLRQAWLEYCQATFGQRALTWSRGLRWSNTTDEELAARYMREEPIVGWVEGAAYVEAERLGDAWKLAKWIGSDPAEADAWLTSRGYQAVRYGLAPVPTPAPRYQPLRLRRGQVDEELARKVSSVAAASARISAWAAVSRLGPDARAAREQAAELDHVARLARGEEIRAKRDPRTGEWVPDYRPPAPPEHSPGPPPSEDWDPLADVEW